jgi:DNA-binding LacI/PurR family transcriptional regulator
MAVVTRTDVAKKANVSPAVVSYVINNSNYVSKEKRDAVLSAIEELGYYPNFIAKSFKTKKTNHLAIISDDLQNEYFNELVYVMEKIAYSKGYYLSLFSNRAESPRLLANYQVDGVFLFTTKFNADQINTLAKAGIPTVLCNSIEYSDLDPRINKVSLEFFSSMRDMTNYLINKGHKNIAYLSTAPITSENEKNYRFQGYTSALRDNGLQVKMKLVDYYKTDLPDLISHAVAMLKGRDNPTAFIAGNDSIALRLMGCLQKRGCKIPNDISVIGAGNIQLGQYFSPALTTINYRNSNLAQTVINHLFDIREGRNVENVSLDVELIFRESA